ncbi:MAG: hypothetical protein V7L00_28320 [Nostoc sp.]|uniref:hypothetical protein n=1 Tax=Nostoc sp. TaxID=1180 RepID=UPI002FF7111A
MNEIKWQSLNLENIPTDAGLYAFKYNERWLYIGSANNLSVRLGNHHLPLQIARKYFPGASFLCYLEDSSQKLKQKLHKQLSPEWNGGTSFEPVQWSEMYAGTGMRCLTQHNFSTIKDEQVFWQCLAIHQPQRFEACFSNHKKILALALQGQYHTAVNKESLQQAVKAAINSL